MSTSGLPLTVQDDIEAKEKYAAQQRNGNARSCSSRRLRLLCFIAFVSLATLCTVRYYGNHRTNASLQVIGEDDAPLHIAPVHTEETVQPLEQEIQHLVTDNQLIVFSKTYCPFSKKAKRILSSYSLKEPLKVIEVDLRDDDYQVKMTLDELSGRATFPNIFLNGQSIGGSDDLEMLHESGELERLLRENQLIV